MQQTKQQNIRNFCIIAHIDHGKSTLADRLLETTNTIKKRDLKQQTLDSMDLEREKGITIKLKAVRMNYETAGQVYQLNLIDTPGHVDFAYEVSRSLAACEGAILIVDASQGIEAQTVSNIYKALDANLTIIPVINKIDLTSANVEKVTNDLNKAFGFRENEIIKISAKSGEGVDKVLKKIVTEIPAPYGKHDSSTRNSEIQPLRALIFDTFYDDYLGVIAHVKIVDGSISKESIKKGAKISFLATKAVSNPETIGIMIPGRKEVDILNTGEVGYIATGLKDISAVKVGDTITFEHEKSKVSPLPGYKEVNPFVFVSIYPIENNRFPDLREGLEKLALSDSALQFEPESSTALGFGFRCGFLGLLHADIIQERLEREYNLDLISTTPTVEYEVIQTDDVIKRIKTPAELPIPTKIAQIKEPWILINIITPSKYVGGIITLCETRRGIQKKMSYVSEDTVNFEYELPLSELIHNFFDELKTVSSGFASVDYEILDYRKVDVVKLDILVHGNAVEPLAQIVLKQSAREEGKKILVKLKETLPRQQFKVALQAAIGGKIVARENIPAARKDVLAGIYGGHRERKDKLLERQKKGKKRMKRIGSVDIPQDAFRKVLKT